VPEIRHLECGELGNDEKCHTQRGILQKMMFAVERTEGISGFSPKLGWAHYRTLMTVKNRNERLFYEIEAEKENKLSWSQYLFLCGIDDTNERDFYEIESMQISRQDAGGHQ